MHRPVPVLLLAVLTSLSVVCAGDVLARECLPDVVESNMTSCLQAYKEHLDQLQSIDERFYTGADVEYIRIICSSLETSMTCIKRATSHCPENERRVIETILSPHLPVRQLCLIKHLFEDYAMNQNCYSKHRAQSEHCFETFSSSTSSSSSSSSSFGAHASGAHASWAPLPTADDDTAVATHRHNSYCRQVKLLSSCVKKHIRKSCHSGAVRLVEPLVSASLPRSVHCSTKEETSTPEAQTNTKSGASYGSISSSTASLSRRDTSILSALLHHPLLTPLLIITYCSNTPL